MKKQKIYIVAGPTASGKSELALKLAEHKKGQIVNADAFQVYQGLRVLTARPSIKEEAQVPHFLYGFVDNQTQISVFDWLKKVSEILPDLSCPIVTGGTGMYIHALINGINQMPEIPEEIRQFVRQMDDEERIQRLKNNECPLDPQRQKRALEVLLATGKPISYFQNQPNIQLVKADFVPILLQPSREIIYKKCADRLEKMFESGAIEEVKNLLKSKACGGVMKAIGVPEIIQYLNHNISLEEAKEKILLSTRHYAKRQRTWFNHQYAPKMVLETPFLEDVITL